MTENQVPLPLRAEGYAIHPLILLQRTVTRNDIKVVASCRLSYYGGTPLSICVFVKQNCHCERSEAISPLYYTYLIVPFIAIHDPLLLQAMPRCHCEPFTFCHCERSKAISPSHVQPTLHPRDCFVAIASRNDVFLVHFVAVMFTVKRGLLSWQALSFLSLRAEGEAIPVVMLNLFQHLSFQYLIPEIPKQVRNDRGAKGVQRDFPLAGNWGCPPAILIPPSP